MYYLTYPFKIMNLSQSYTQGNHVPHWQNAGSRYDYPIDEACENTGKSPVYAPVNVKVVNIKGLNTTATTNCITVETVETVRTPIGDYKIYMTFTHPDESDLKKLKVGQIIKKGSIICYEGKDGKVTGNHIHMTAGIAPYKSMYKNKNGKWCHMGKTPKKPEEVFYVNTKFTKIKNQRNIKFKTLTTDAVVENVKPTPTVTVSPKFKIGDKVIISGKLYINSNAATVNGSVKNKTTTITRYASGAKHPYNTTGDLGWMNESDIKAYSKSISDNTLKVGDKVKIVGTGNGSSLGNSDTAYGIGWSRQILKIWTGRKYPYQVGDNKGTVGFYKADALKKQ